MRYLAKIGDRELAVEVVRRGAGRYTVRLDGRERLVETRTACGATILTLDGRRLEGFVGREANGGARAGERTYAVAVAGRDYRVRLSDPLRRAAAAAGPRTLGRIEVRAIMPGRIGALLVAEGQEVAEGQGLLVVEAMKMENEIPSPRDGRVSSVKVRPGEAVEAGALLLSIE